MTISVTDLRCERLIEPIGLGTATPRLSWRLDAGDASTGVLQEAWQIQVGDDDVTWDTGRIEGREQSAQYDGPPMPARARRWWRVKAWTSAGETDWSERYWFEVGLLDPSDWSASMITACATTPVVRFSSFFELDDVGTARLYLTAHGAIIATLNGAEVGDEVLAPGWTSYHHRLAVRTHDVTTMLRPGTNELAALVAPAWFSGRFGLRGSSNLYGSHVGVLAQLEIDGGLVSSTDASWRATSTPFLLAEIYDGETFDARATDGDAAEVAVLESFDHAVLIGLACPPVRRIQTLSPVSRETAGDGAVLVDFGQNLVGRMRLTVRDAPAGAEVVMRHAEVLGPDGRLFTEPLRTAKATDTYIARGDGVETYEPAFTFHGFRYAEITGVPVDGVEVEAVVIHSDLERTGTFTCSDPLIQRLHDNVVWGQRGNFLSVPTDCPQRDERLGWTGDAQVFSPTASFIYDCQTFWENWLEDLAADQNDGMVPPVIPDIGLEFGNGAAGWADAAVVVPWTTYEATGDAAVLARALPSMTSCIDWEWSRLDDEHRWRRDFQFGDWLDPDAPAGEPWRAKAKFDLVASAYAVRSTSLVARAARVLNEDTLARRYEERAGLLREAWWHNYADDAPKTQTGGALAIEFDLAPDPDARQGLGDALAKLVRDADDHLATGFLGTPVLLPALTRTGHLDVAYDVLMQRTSPSWLYQVLAGATTIWERWDALRSDGSVATDALGFSGASMVSFNHYAYGCVADWLHSTVAGLAPGEPGYRHVIVHPRPGGGLTSAGAELMMRYGRTSVAWRVDGDRFHLDVTIPPNATATVTLPDATTIEVRSGAHSFSCPS